MRSAERRKVNVLEMKCLGSLVGVSRMDRVRNEEVRSRAGIERELASRADPRALRWFGHVERMDENRMTRRVLMAEVEDLGHQRDDGGGYSPVRNLSLVRRFANKTICDESSMSDYLWHCRYVGNPYINNIDDS